MGLHELELPQDIYLSSWRRALAGVLAAWNDMKLATIGQRRTRNDRDEDIATFFHKFKNGQLQAESIQLMQILVILTNARGQLALRRTALKKEEERLYQRFKDEGVLKPDEKSRIRPSKAETAIDKVVTMIQEDYYQANTQSKADEDLAHATIRFWQTQKDTGERSEPVEEDS
ncbi:hypothetical protein D0863_14735 [Hortaea werneckii]|uniref:Uncharacterized protein n=1 Tax=Hortaea werneckii TaxID=91943 RepID=A0A3M7CFV0_HORWE|nr:hypothetical protein D0863_14735 [Hortaea werneckii]